MSSSMNELPLPQLIARIQAAPNHFRTLGFCDTPLPTLEDMQQWTQVEEEAFSTQVRGMFRRLAMRLHPDKRRDEAVSQQAAQGDALDTVGEGSTSGSVDDSFFSAAEMDAAFRKVQTAHEILRDSEKIKSYRSAMSSDNDVLLPQSVEDWERTELLSKKTAQAMTVMMMAATGLFSSLDSRGAPPAPVLHPCATTSCKATVSVLGSFCPSCQIQPLNCNKSKCSMFGCLRRILPEDVVAVTAGGTTLSTVPVMCSHCRNKPKKCKEFGCLVMVKDGGEKCLKHR